MRVCERLHEFKFQLEAIEVGRMCSSLVWWWWHVWFRTRCKGSRWCRCVAIHCCCWVRVYVGRTKEPSSLPPPNCGATIDIDIDMKRLRKHQQHAKSESWEFSVNTKASPKSMQSFASDGQLRELSSRFNPSLVLLTFTDALYFIIILISWSCPLVLPAKAPLGIGWTRLILPSDPWNSPLLKPQYWPVGLLITPCLLNWCFWLHPCRHHFHHDSWQWNPPIAFHSRTFTFTNSEHNYETCDKGLLAVFNCFKVWHHYLEGSQHGINVMTDHKNLEYFSTTKMLTHHQFSAFNLHLSHPNPGPSGPNIELRWSIGMNQSITMESWLSAWPKWQMKTTVEPSLCSEEFIFFTAQKNLTQFLTYFHHSLVCFSFDGILMSLGYITSATDYIPCQWSPLAHKGEDEQWVTPSLCDDIAFFLYFYSYYSYSAPFCSVLLHSTPLLIPDSPISPIAITHHTLWLCRA